MEEWNKGEFKAKMTLVVDLFQQLRGVDLKNSDKEGKESPLY